MRVLLTGNRGLIGAVIETRLRAEGHEVVGFDRVKRDDIRNFKALERRARRCDAVVHSAAVPSNAAGTPEEILAVNVAGTFKVLRAAEAIGAPVVYLSSVQALGICEGADEVAYLPVGDDYPGRPSRIYGQAKRFTEDLFESFTDRSGLTSVCLRPVKTWDERRYERNWHRIKEDASPGELRHWDYGSFVDVRDVAAAVSLALELPAGVHARVLLCGDDIAASRPVRETIETVLPDIEWRGGEAYDADPWRGVFDCSRAREVLGWQPEHRWATWVSHRAASDPATR